MSILLHKPYKVKVSTKGEGGQKSPYFCPHGLWMAPKYVRSIGKMCVNLLWIQLLSNIINHLTFARCFRFLYSWILEKFTFEQNASLCAQDAVIVLTDQPEPFYNYRYKHFTKKKLLLLYLKPTLAREGTAGKNPYEQFHFYVCF